MDREEAIKRLKWFKEYNEEDYCGGDRIQDDSGDWYYLITEEDLEAFEIAIEALEQESSSSEIPNKSEAKIDCNNTYCNNCVNHKYCDYESNKSEIPTSSIAQERYQDLIDYFGNEKVAKTILEDRKEFKAWLERLRWHVKIANEFVRKIEQIQRPTKNDLEVDWNELKRRILMEVDGGTDDKWLRYADVCDRISDSIDKYIADMREVDE